MAENVNDVLKESISALVDGEMNELELARVVKASGDSAEVRDVWRRYHLASALLRGDAKAVDTTDLSENIRLAIEAEEPIVMTSDYSSGVSSLKQWRDGLAKVAVAATVAFGFVIGVQKFGVNDNVIPGIDTQQNTVNTASENTGSAVVPAGITLPPLRARNVSAGPNGAPRRSVRAPAYFSPQTLPSRGHVVTDPALLQDHLSRSLLKHAEQSSLNSNLGVIPFARVTKIEPSQVDKFGFEKPQD